VNVHKLKAAIDTVNQAELVGKDARVARARCNMMRSTIGAQVNKEIEV
jgi:hypothetical protein